MFMRESWYVFGWAKDLEKAERPLGRTIIGEPIVVWRGAEGTLHAMEDRCPHRHAPLSMGRVRGSTLQCMYHGLTIDAAGHCTAMPLMSSPPAASVRVYPIAEKDSWLWVWMGDFASADETLIPTAFGIDDPCRPMRANSIEYDANYQLVHDNLCDLSHVDFVHAETLRPATGAQWSQSAPRIRMHGRSLRFERWFEGAEMPGGSNEPVDVWSRYEFILPGIFIMQGARYPAGTAALSGYTEPSGVEPISLNIEQQAVTPISERRTAYHYATGLVGNSPEMTAALALRMDVVMATFEEDREMIEAQQRIWNLTPSSTPKMFLLQDKGPAMMRKMIAAQIRSEAKSSGEPASLSDDRTHKPATEIAVL